MEQVKAPLGQRVYSAMKRTREDILNHCSTINVFFVVYYTSLWGPTCRGPTPVYASPLHYKRETPVREGLRSERDLEVEDRLIHRHKNNTTLSGRRVLRSGGPNHSKSSSVLVFLLQE